MVELDGVVSSLQELHGYSGAPEAYETRLRETIDAVAALLGYRQPAWRRLVVGERAWVYFAGAPWPAPEAVGPQALLCYLNQYPEDTSKDATPDAVPKGEAAASDALSALTSLVRFFRQLHRSAESALVEAVEARLAREAAFYASLKTQLDSELSADDTARAVASLEAVVGTPAAAPAAPPAEPPAATPTATPTGPPADWRGPPSNDPTFNQIYHLFLHLSSRGSPGYARVMVGMFKRHVGAEFLELDDFATKDLKVHYFYEQFLGGGLFPEEYRAVTERVAAEVDVFPEMRRASERDGGGRPPPPKREGDSPPPGAASRLESPPGAASRLEPPPPPPPAPVASPTFSADLVSTLKHILPQLDNLYAFSPAFPPTVRVYLRLLDDPLKEPRDDAYVDRLLHLLNTVIDFENDDADASVDVHETVRELYLLHLALTGSADSTDSTVLMRLAACEHRRDAAVLARLLGRWSRKTLAVSQLDYVYAHQWPLEVRRRVLRVWYARYQRHANSLAAAADSDNRRAVAQAWQRWRHRQAVVQAAAATARQLDLERWWAVWRRERSRACSQSARADDHRAQALVRHAWARWRHAARARSALAEAADELRATQRARSALAATRSAWRVWRGRLEQPPAAVAPLAAAVAASPAPAPAPAPIPTLLRKLVHLRHLERAFTLAKHFRAWRRQLELSQNLTTARARTEGTLVRFFAAKWRAQLQLHALGRAAVARTNAVIVRNAFANWRQLMELHARANAQRNRHLEAATLKAWRLKAAERAAAPTPAAAFKRWRLALIYKTSQRRRHTDVERQAMAAWRARLAAVRALAERVPEHRLYRVFVLWIEHTVRRADDAAAADRHVQRKSWRQWRWRHAAVARLGEEAPPLTSALRAAWSRWRSRFEAAREQALRHRVAHFRQGADRALLRRALETWAQSYNHRQHAYHELESRSDAFARASLAPRALGRWRQRLAATRGAAQQASALQSQFLLKKHLVQWFERLEATHELEDEAERIAGQRQIHRARQLLNAWYMRYHKHVKRHRDSCDEFVARWSRAKQRAILEVWRYKARNKGRPADTSVASVGSPLSSRSQGYWHTPLKRRSAAPHTPNSPTTSPTKLQETTERIKSERMGRLIRHYQRAKAPAATPVGSAVPASLSSTFIRLSPSKAYTMAPPRAPNFAADDDEPSIFQVSPTADEERSRIETAKQLRKITPIYVPSEHEQTPRFSPVSKLRSRRPPLVASTPRSSPTHP
ncbi:Sfi1 spindle body domain-containing protein [[Candida] zeylanoides]